MDNEIKSVPSEASSGSQSAPDTFGFKFFKNCSETLKRFSVLMFIVNIFIVVVAAAIGIVLLIVNTSTELFSVLIIPIISAIIIGVVFARFISALIYGFAELVEKAEKDNK